SSDIEPTVGAIVQYFHNPIGGKRPAMIYRPARTQLRDVAPEHTADGIEIATDIQRATVRRQLQRANAGSPRAPGYRNIPGAVHGTLAAGEQAGKVAARYRRIRPVPDAGEVSAHIDLAIRSQRQRLDGSVAVYWPWHPGVIRRSIWPKLGQTIAILPVDETERSTDIDAPVATDGDRFNRAIEARAPIRIEGAIRPYTQDVLAYLVAINHMEITTHDQPAVGLPGHTPDQTIIPGQIRGSAQRRTVGGQCDPTDPIQCQRM